MSIAGSKVGRYLNRVAVVMHLPETTKPRTTNRLAFSYPRGEGGQPFGCDVELLGLLWEPLLCLQNRGRRNRHCLLKQSVPVPVRCSSLFGALKNVKVKKGFPDVTAVFQLGNWCLSRSLSKNVFDHLLFSRSFRSLPTYKAASPADFP